MTTRRVMYLGIAAGLCAAAPAGAQAKLELTPFFGSYYAISTMSDDILDDGSNIRVKQIAAPSIGGRFTYWMSSGLGFEAAGSYGLSGVRVYDEQSQGAGFSLNGNMTTVTGRVMYRLPRSNFHVLGGGGVMIRSGDAWEGLEKLTSPTGVAGFGVRAQVTPKLALDVKVEGYFYSFKPRDPGTGNDAFPTKFQTDAVVSIGIPIGLAR